MGHCFPPSAPGITTYSRRRPMADSDAVPSGSDCAVETDGESVSCGRAERAAPKPLICPEKQERFLHKGELLNRRSCCLLPLGLTQLTEASLMLPWVTVLLGWDVLKVALLLKGSRPGFKGFFFSNVKGNSLPVSNHFIWTALLIFSNGVFKYTFQLAEFS